MIATLPRRRKVRPDSDACFLDYFAGQSQKPTNMHRLDPDGSVTEVATDLHFPNAAAIINDARTLVVNETWVGRVTAFDLAENGELSNRRVVADLAGRGPDGMCADASGAGPTRTCRTP